MGLCCPARGSARCGEGFRPAPKVLPSPVLAPALPAYHHLLFALHLDRVWCELWAWHGLCTLQCLLLLLPNSAILFVPLSLLCPSLAPTPHRVYLAQGRLSEEIEKLRQEVDQLKGRGGPLVDGIHSRYWSTGGWVGSWWTPRRRLPPTRRPPTTSGRDTEARRAWPKPPAHWAA